MADAGTKVVAGVTPGRAGQDVDGVPVFDTVEDAVRESGANTCVTLVPARFAADAVYEAVDAGVGLVVCITEGIPVHDTINIRARLNARQETRLLGPNCPGVTSPGESNVGIMPADIFKQGPVGVVSRSGTLTYEVVAALAGQSLGQSTCVGIGGDPVIGTGFVDVLRMFEADRKTKGIALIGEIGGTDEELAAEVIAEEIDKPVVGFIAGRSAPPEKRMGHAGAIVSGGVGTASAKIDALGKAGVPVGESTDDIARLLEDLL
jgi:succinyl-CoA synthetase alpha subunit